MIHSVMIFNRQGRTRLEKWYTATSQKQKSKVVRNLTEMIPRRPSRFSNIIEMSDIKVVYKDRVLSDVGDNLSSRFVTNIGTKML